MKKTNAFLRFLSVIACLVLIAAMALTMTACGNTAVTSDPSSSVTNSLSDTESVIGEGKTEFGLTVTDVNGVSSVFTVRTDKTTVGDALLELDLIAGDESEYGLYVKTVNGITADYDTDGTYWAFYIDGEYASSGVDTTDITAGAMYELKVEK